MAKQRSKDLQHQREFLSKAAALLPSSVCQDGYFVHRLYASFAATDATAAGHEVANVYDDACIRQLGQSVCRSCLGPLGPGTCTVKIVAKVSKWKRMKQKERFKKRLEIMREKRRLKRDASIITKPPDDSVEKELKATINSKSNTDKPLITSNHSKKGCPNANNPSVLIKCSRCGENNSYACTQPPKRPKQPRKRSAKMPRSTETSNSEIMSMVTVQSSHPSSPANFSTLSKHSNSLKTPESAQNLRFTHYTPRSSESPFALNSSSTSNSRTPYYTPPSSPFTHSAEKSSAKFSSSPKTNTSTPLHLQQSNDVTATPSDDSTRQQPVLMSKSEKKRLQRQLDSPALGISAGKKKRKQQPQEMPSLLSFLT